MTTGSNKLKNKVAIVTGASRGIGESIARLFAAEGAKVVCAARSLNEGDHKLFSGSLNSTVAEIEKDGGVAIAVQTDPSKEEDCARLIQKTHEAYGSVDILVNNAAVSYFVPIKDLSVKQWDISMSVGPRAMFIMCKSVLPVMPEKSALSEKAIGIPRAERANFRLKLESKENLGMDNVRKLLFKLPIIPFTVSVVIAESNVLNVPASGMMISIAISLPSYGNSIA